MITDANETNFTSLGCQISNPMIGLKTYRSTLNKIINNKKITNIPQLQNGIFVEKLQSKADIFKDLSVQQFSFNVNVSFLPNFISTGCPKNCFMCK